MRSLAPIHILLPLILLAPGAAETPPGSVPGLDVQDKHLGDIVAWVERTAGVTVLLAEELEHTRISIRTEGSLPWLDCLREIASAADADLRGITDTVVRLDRPRRVSMELVGVRYRDVCRVLARLANQSIVVPGDLEEADRALTVSLHEVPWRDALDSITRAVGLVVVEEASGSAIRVSAIRITSTGATRDETLRARLRALEQALRERVRAPSDPRR